MGAFASSQRAVIHGKLHDDGRRIDGHEWQGWSVCGTGDGLADVHVFKAADADDVTCAAFDGVAGGEGGVLEDLGDLHRDGFVLGCLAQQENAIAQLDGAACDFSDGDTANEIVPINVRDEHLEAAFKFRFRSRDVFNDLFEEEGHVLLLAVRLVTNP